MQGATSQEETESLGKHQPYTNICNHSASQRADISNRVPRRVLVTAKERPGQRNATLLRMGPNLPPSRPVAQNFDRNRNLTMRYQACYGTFAVVE